MSIVLARIDNRLIHGQVLESWVPYAHADCIVVANDQVAGQAFQRRLMQAAVPRGIRVEIGTVEEVARLFRDGELAARQVLLLFASAADALRAHRCGVDFRELNLGNMHGGQGRVRFSCTITLDPVDIESLDALEAEGIRIESRCIPSDAGTAWRKLLQAGGTGR